MGGRATYQRKTKRIRPNLSFIFVIASGTHFSVIASREAAKQSQRSPRSLTGPRDDKDEGIASDPYSAIASDTFSVVIASGTKWSEAISEIATSVLRASSRWLMKEKNAPTGLSVMRIYLVSSF